MLALDTTFLIVDFVSVSDPGDPILVVFLRKSQGFETITEE